MLGAAGEQCLKGAQEYAKPLLSQGLFCLIVHTCGSKPMSNMRSASSMTRYVTRRRLVTCHTVRLRVSCVVAGISCQLLAEGTTACS